MGYDFTIGKSHAVRVKKAGEYPWPWLGDGTRTIELFTDDVLTQTEPGKYTKHTGLCCTNIRLNDSEVELWDRDVNLRLL